MKLKLETVLTGLLVGILLYCVCNQLFLVEGVCQRGCSEGQMCPHEKECPPSGCCDKGTTPPAPPTPPTPAPPTPAPPTPAPPTDEICSKLKKETCLIDGDVKYGCVNTDSGQNDAQLGYVYSCNKKISTRQDCDKLRTPFKWCPSQNEPEPGPTPPTPPTPPGPSQLPLPDKCSDIQYWKDGCQDNGEPSNGWSQDMKDKIIVNNQLNENITFQLSQDGEPFTERISVVKKAKSIKVFPVRFNDKRPGEPAAGGRITIYNTSGQEIAFAEFAGGKYGGVNISYVDRLSYPIKVKTCNQKSRGCCFESIEKYNEYNHDCCPFGQSNDSDFVGCLSQRDYCLTKTTDSNYEKYCGDDSHLTAKEVGCPNPGNKSEKAFDIWGCLPDGKYSGETVGANGKTEVQCCAALNRGVDYLDAGQYDIKGEDTSKIKPTSNFYKRPDEKYNIYSKMVHEICPGGESPEEDCGGGNCGIFGFSHDDVNKSGGFMGFDAEQDPRKCGGGGFEIVIG